MTLLHFAKKMNFIDTRKNSCKMQLTGKIITRVTKLIYDQGIVRKVLLLLFSGICSEFRGKSAGLKVEAKGNDDEDRKEGMMETRTVWLVTVPV